MGLTILHSAHPVEGRGLPISLPMVPDLRRDERDSGITRRTGVLTDRFFMHFFKQVDTFCKNFLHIIHFISICMVI